MKQEESAELGSMNLQYSYQAYYRSTTISLYAFTWEFYAMVKLVLAPFFRLTELMYVIAATG